MKNLLSLFALIVTTVTVAQNISPVITGEFCPNQEYTFSVSSLPGNYISIDVFGGATVTQYPSGSGTSITFKGKFSDINGTQTFSIIYSGGSKPFNFTKVKSLFSGYKEGNVSPVVAPMCQTTSITFSITGDKYLDTSTNPYTSFGSINDYDYIIPAGWRLNGTLSIGNNWISASGSITLTPDANTGNSSTIQYKAKSDCSSAFHKGDIKYVPISRPNPIFTIYPTSLSFDCGTPQTKTFTVSTTNSLSCSISYSWSLGANNGWIYNGSPAPANLTTSTNSIALTSANGNVLPSSVYVTPILDGKDLTQLNSITSFTPFTSTAEISGITSFCSLQSTSIFTINAGTGNTVTWSSSNSQIASISNPTNSQVSITSQSQGLFYVNATITNPCGQTVPKSSLPITIGTPMPLIDGYTCVSESAPCFLNATANNNYLTFSLSASLGNYLPLDSDWQWEKVSGNFYLLDNGQYNSATHTGRQCNIYLTGANPTDNPLKLRCRVRNACGWGQWRNYEWNDGTTTPITPPAPPEKYYVVAPNPTGGYAAYISLLNPAIVPTTTSPIIIRLYTIYGQELTSTQMYNNSSGEVYIYSYPYDWMYINITFDNHSETHTIVKY